MTLLAPTGTRHRLVLVVGALLASAGLVLLSGGPAGADPVAPVCTFEDPSTAAPADAVGLHLGGLGFECDGPGVLTLALSVPSGALGASFGGISVQAVPDRTDPIIGLAFGPEAVPSGSFWILSQAMPAECTAAADGNTFGAACSGTPSEGGDLVASLVMDGPVIGMVGSYSAEAFYVTELVVDPPSATTTTTTTSTSSTTTTLPATTTTVDPTLLLIDSTERMRGAMSVSVGIASFGGFAIFAGVVAVAVRSRHG